MSSPSIGTLRPKSSFEWRLGTKRTTNGPSSYGARGATSTAESARPCRRISCASDADPYALVPNRRAIAGASIAWSKCVWPTSTPATSPGARM